MLPDYQNQMDAFSSNNMSWFIIISKISFALCLTFCIYTLIRIASLGKSTDYSKTKGSVSSAVKYSFTGGMSPAKKESAYMHLPTYIAGMLFHIGTFLCLALFLFNLFEVEYNYTLKIIISVIILLSGISGLFILIKRIVKTELRSLSNADDYISNVIVTLFQLATIMFLFVPNSLYYVISGALFLYLPVGKLKHTIYFFAARYHLGLFFGKRGVWPPQN